MTRASFPSRGPLRGLWALVFLSSFVFPVRADLVIKQQVEGAQTGEMTLHLKDGKSRADLAQPVSMITDAATGDTTLLQHAKKTFVRLPASRTKALAEQMLQAQTSASAPKLHATGLKEKIGGHECELHLWSVGTLRMKFWVAKTYPNAAAIQQQLDRMQASGLGSVTAAMMPKSADLPGVRLRTEIEMQGQKVSYTITSISEAPVDAAVFDIPKGYLEERLPLSGPAE